jgi:hypothetical protein
VVLAILFVGGPEHLAFTAAKSQVGGQPCRAGAQPVSKRALYGNARTALALLPALLQHTCSIEQAQFPSSSLGQRNAPVLLGLRLDATARGRSMASLGPGAIWQRPPPSV